MIDTHCHLNISEFENLDEIINKMKEENIYAIINGSDIDSNNEANELAAKYINLYSANGYHPENIEDLSKDYLNILESNIKKIIAIGEIGLDYYWRTDNKDKQIKIFKEQLSLAQNYNKPVIIHSRESIQDVYDIIKNYKLKGIIHAFSGSLEMAKEFIKLGYKIGIGGVITFKNSKLKDVIKNIDIKDIVLETDSPYLSPEPVRGTKNTPLNLKYIAKFISDIKGIEYNEVINITTNTAKELFDL